MKGVPPIANGSRDLPARPSSRLDQVRLAEIVDHIRGGDSQALRALREALEQTIRGVVSAHLQVSADIDEVTEEVFQVAWLHAGAYDLKQGSVRSWLIVVARNRSIDLLRQQECRRSVSLEAMLSRLSRNSGIRLERMFMAAATIHGIEREGQPSTSELNALQRALCSLTPFGRRVVEMAFLQDLSHRQIAARTGVPLGTVKSQVRRSLATLKRLLSARH